MRSIKYFPKKSALAHIVEMIDLRSTTPTIAAAVAVLQILIHILKALAILD